MNNIDTEDNWRKVVKMLGMLISEIKEVEAQLTLKTVPKLAGAIQVASWYFKENSEQFNKHLSNCEAYVYLFLTFNLLESDEPLSLLRLQEAIEDLSGAMHRLEKWCEKEVPEVPEATILQPVKTEETK